MPRSSSRSSRSAPTRTFHSTPVAAPRPVAAPPAPVPSYSSPTMGQAIKEGVGYGIGSSIGQRLTSAVFGAPTIAVKTEVAPAAPPSAAALPPGACADYVKLKSALDLCVKDSWDCSQQIEDYKTCIKDMSSK